MSVLAIGDNCIDVYVDAGTGYPGGGPVNVAAYLARAGVRVAYAGAVGEDPSGRHLIDALRAEGVDTSLVQVRAGVTNLAFVGHERGDRVFLGRRAGVRDEFRWQDVPASALERARVVHTTVDGHVDDLLAALPAATTVVYDFSRKYRPEHRALLPHIDVAAASAAHLGDAEIAALARDWIDAGCGTVLLTRGERGSVAFTASGTVHCDAQPAPVVDTLGCGDAFIAGFIAALLDDEPLPRRLERGRDTAAVALGQRGAFGHGRALSELGLDAEVPS